MSYELYITRAESWLDDPSPITLAEIERTLPILPEGFSIDRSGIVSATTPAGKALTAVVGDYLVYEDNAHPDNRIHIYFDCERPPSFRLSHPKQLAPVIDLAEELGARVQGDEMEFYSREDIPKLCREWDQRKRKGFLKKFSAKMRKLLG